MNTIKHLRKGRACNLVLKEQCNFSLVEELLSEYQNVCENISKRIEGIAKPRQMKALPSVALVKFKALKVKDKMLVYGKGSLFQLSNSFFELRCSIFWGGKYFKKNCFYVCNVWCKKMFEEMLLDSKFFFLIRQPFLSIKGTVSSRSEQTFNRAWKRCPSVRWTQWLKVTGSFMQQHRYIFSVTELI